MSATPITQAEIARRVGVSRTMVAFALNDRLHTRMSAETRNRILKMVNESGYRPHRQAQLLRKVKSAVIGIIKTPGYMEAPVDRAFAMANEIHRLGYRPLNSDLLGEHGMRMACDAMIDERVEGVIYDGPVATTHRIQLQRLQDAGIPLLTFCGDRIPGVPYVAQDIQGGMKELTQHLLRIGHRKPILIIRDVMMIADSYQDLTMQARIDGYQEAISEAGLPPGEVFYQPNVEGVDDLYGFGYLAAHEILSRKQHPDVLVCANDYWAAGAIKACHEKGVNVPSDIAITGFESTLIGNYTISPLTTTRQPWDVTAKKAVETLVAIVRGEKTRVSNEVCRIPFELVVRESCGAHLRSNILTRDKKTPKK